VLNDTASRVPAVITIIATAGIDCRRRVDRDPVARIASTRKGEAT